LKARGYPAPPQDSGGVWFELVLFIIYTSDFLTRKKINFLFTKITIILSKFVVKLLKLGTYKRILGVYRITNLVNGKNYIGISKSIYKRWEYHRYRLKKGIHDNIHLQSAWNKYGKENFEFKIIEECQVDSLQEREDYWINFFNSIHREKGYNRLLSGKVPESVVINTNNLHKTREANYKPVVAINVHNWKILECSSGKEASELTGVISKRINASKRYWRDSNAKVKKSFSGWTFVPSELYDEKFDYITYQRPKTPYRYKPKPEKKQTKRSYKKKPEDIIPYSERNVGRKPVKLVHSETGEELIFRSQLEARQTLNLVSSKMHYCLKNPGKNKHRGYFFFPLDTREVA
jgi:group I intron endonuclease